MSILISDLIRHDEVIKHLHHFKSKDISIASINTRELRVRVPKGTELPTILWEYNVTAKSVEDTVWVDELGNETDRIPVDYYIAILRR